MSAVGADYRQQCLMVCAGALWEDEWQLDVVETALRDDGGVCANCGHGAQGTRVSVECITYNGCFRDGTNSVAIGGANDCGQVVC